MKADGGLQLRALARELQYDRAAEAEADRSQSARIDLRQACERRQRRAAAGAQSFRLGAQTADDGCDLLQVARLPPLAEHVGGERDIAELGHHARPLHREIAEPQPLVKHRTPGRRAETLSSQTRWPRSKTSSQRYSRSRVCMMDFALPFRLSASGTSHRFEAGTTPLREQPLPPIRWSPTNLLETSNDRVEDV